MTQTSHTPRQASTIPEQSPRIGVPPTSVEMTQHAVCINGAALDDPGAHFGASWIFDTGALSWSYTRTAQARYLCVRAIIQANGGSAGAFHGVQIDLSVTDGTSTRTSSDDEIPTGFRNEVLAGLLNENGTIVPNRTVVGYIDLDAVAAHLTASSDWRVTASVTVTGFGHIQRIHAWEVPGFAIDDAVTGRGVLVGNYSRDREIVDTPLGCEELITQDDYAVTEQRTILSTAWRQQVADSTETPSCASTSYGAVSLLDEGGAVGHFRTIARALPTPGADVPIRFRVLYRMTGGSTQTGQVRINTGASGGPWATSSLSYTTSWTWSAWITAAHLSGADEVTIEAKVSASPAVLWIAAIAVMEACAP
jgi:hypothetical protein